MLTLIAIGALQMANPALREPLLPGLGTHHRAVNTRSALAQRYFDQGLNLLMAFNHDEARTSFQQSAKLDPRCAMAYWGIATANGPHINNPMVDPAREAEAFNALRRARSLPTARPVDRSLILAASKRFAQPQPASRAKLDEAYANAMRQVWAKYPSDADVGSLFAESMMDLRPWDLWKVDGKPQPGTLEIVATLERVLKLNPNHPLGNHLYIHAVEASPTPGRGMTAANRLRLLQPGLGHNTHMPSHIDVRTGKWHESIAANLRAIKSDAEYRAKRPNQGFYRIYMLHNFHMLGFGGMMTGQGKLAIEAMDRMVADIPTTLPEPMYALVDGYISMPTEVRIRFGKWDEVLARPEPAAHFPIARAMRHAARSIAFAAKGRVDEARFAQAQFKMSLSAVPEGATFGNNLAADLLKLTDMMVEGEIRLASGDTSGGIKELYRAAAIEDQLRYDEPPDWILPIRHPLGAALIKAGRFAEAEKVYRQDLARWPENGWALRGMSQALAGQGKSDAAKQFADRFATMWRKSDTSISSSCMCIPVK
jgi:tetratricopeptide (TPR) repeat protein